MEEKNNLTKREKQLLEMFRQGKTSAVAQGNST